MTTANPLASDLDEVLALTRDLWEDLRGGRLFLTGGTGFFGCWLLETFLWANERLELGAEVHVLTRNAARFRAKAPHLANQATVKLLEGDVATFTFPALPFTHVIHAATDVSVANLDERLIFDATVQGTRHVLDFAIQAGVRRFLNISSGAVYGRQPSEIRHLPEDFPGAPDPTAPSSVYGEGKRVGEMLCALYHKHHGLEASTARCYAFVGPYQPLDQHFAIANFIGDGLQGNTIQVGGDGTAYRSYLYASDLAVWLWTLLFKGQPTRAYNVGSEDDLSIGELAHAVARVFPEVPGVRIAQAPMPGGKPSRYVPSTQRAQSELGLRQIVDLSEAIRRTAGWHRRQAAFALR